MNGTTTIKAWKQLLARKPDDGRKFSSKLKKKMTKNIKRGAKSTMVGGHWKLKNLGGTDSSQLEIYSYFCPEARGTPLGFPGTNDTRE